jgi:hypothetical protein
VYGGMSDEWIRNLREHLSHDALFRYIEKNDWLNEVFDEGFRKAINEEEYYTTPQTAALMGLEDKDWTIRNLLNKYNLDEYVGMQKIKSRLVLDYIGVIKVKMMLFIMDKTDRKPLGIAEMLGQVASTYVSDGFTRHAQASDSTDLATNDDYSKLYMLAFHKKQLEQALKLTNHEKYYLEQKEVDSAAYYEELMSQMEVTKDSYIREIAALEEQIKTIKYQQLLSEQVDNIVKEQASKFSFKKIFKQEPSQDNRSEQINTGLSNQLEQLGEKIGHVKAKISDLEKKIEKMSEKATQDKELQAPQKGKLEEEILEINQNITNVEAKINDEKKNISGDSNMTLFLADDIDIE